MIGIIITGHGSFPTGMQASIEMITGEIKQMRVIPFEEDTTKLESELRTAIEELDTGQGVVCFTDLPGGTPFNICSRLAVENKNIRVIGGTNSPMLLSGVFQRELDLDDYIKHVMEEGKNNIKSFEVKAKDTANSEANGI